MTFVAARPIRRAAAPHPDAIRRLPVALAFTTKRLPMNCETASASEPVAHTLLVACTNGRSIGLSVRVDMGMREAR